MRFRLETRYPDYDTKGHVNNAIYLTYFELARSRAWTEVVQGDPDFPFVLAEARVRYASEGMIGDPLDVEITTREVRTKAWVWAYRVIDARDDRLVAEGETVQVMFDYATRTTVPIPEAVREGLARV